MQFIEKSNYVRIEVTADKDVSIDNIERIVQEYGRRYTIEEGDTVRKLSLDRGYVVRMKVIINILDVSESLRTVVGSVCRRILDYIGGGQCDIQFIHSSLYRSNT